jgi:predicted nucleic acid-binding protein
MSDLGGGPVGLDTAIFIYLIEEHPVYLPVVEPLFGAIDSGNIEAYTSSLTLLETLIIPLRQGNPRLATAYEQLLQRSRGLTMVEMETPVVRTAAELRALSGVKTPDALQLAAALHTNCRIFLTHDRRLPQIPDLKILQLSTFL